jgi:hypothetical protein
MSGSEDYVPSDDMEAETPLKIIRRTTSYTDCFRAYLD